ncbi:MAG: Purine efflux pump PbuE [Pseudomonadota bacterium]|jgi:predicted MFS family arabinose efflux permease
MTQALPPNRERWLLLTLAGVQFTNILDFMIMMPLGPQFTRLWGISNAEFGLLVSAYTLSAGASGLLASTYIDRFGRKRLLLVLYGLFGLATLACGLAPGYGWLMAARIAAGLFGGVLSALVQTIVADAISFERRGRAMSAVMTSFSVATVAGVPLGLWMAAQWSWHAPFVAIAGVTGLLWVMAWRTMPSLRAHLQHGPHPGPLSGVGRVLADPNHLRALALSALMMLAGFLVIPYITLYVQANGGMRDDQVPWIYLCGGLTTLATARLMGQLTDRVGKVNMFRRMALVLPLPLLATTLSEGLPVWALVLIAMALFGVMNARMIPGMALLSAAADPRLRGTFMTLNSALQSGAMGLASIVGGMLIGRDAQGHLTQYWMAGLLGAVVSLITVWLAGTIRLHTGPVSTLKR